MQRRKTFYLQLRPEARTAIVMLAAVQRKGDQSPHKQGIQFWIKDLVDAVSCTTFSETFGMSVAEYLKGVRCRIQRGKRKKYVPRDEQLQRAAERLLLLRDNDLTARPGREAVGTRGPAGLR